LIGRSASELRDPELRRARLAEGEPHLLALPALIADLHQQPEYAANGHAGVLLMKTSELRVVLEVMRSGTELASHAISGPAALQVLDGELALRTPARQLRAMRSDLVALPREESRSIEALRDSAFLLTLALSADTGSSAAGSPGEP
jgi:quercetin dioxygenase-like cupin family protein